jgi:hypothetical protein
LSHLVPNNALAYFRFALPAAPEALEPVMLVQVPVRSPVSRAKPGARREGYVKTRRAACDQVARASAGYFASRTTSEPTLASTCFSASCNTRMFSSVEPPLVLPKTQAASLPLYNAG